MTESVNKDLVRRYYEEIVNSGDVARIEEFIASGYVEVHQNKRYELGTGKTIEVTGVNVDRVVGERIVEHGGAANMLEALLATGSVEIVKR